MILLKVSVQTVQLEGFKGNEGARAPLALHGRRVEKKRPANTAKAGGIQALPVPSTRTQAQAQFDRLSRLATSHSDRQIKANTGAAAHLIRCFRFFVRARTWHNN